MFLTIVNGENRQDFEWEAGRTAPEFVEILEEKDWRFASDNGVAWWKDQEVYGAEEWFDSCEYAADSLNILLLVRWVTIGVI